MCLIKLYSKIEIQSKKRGGPSFPIQIDGEPFELKSPFSITISHMDKVDVLIKESDRRLSAETKIIKVLDWAENSNQITSEQKDILLDKLLKEITTN